MMKAFGVVVVAAFLLAGCASVPMESAEKSAQAKKFNPPTSGNAGLYVYRSGTFGGALKKDVRVDGKCIGESAPDVFFYEEVKGDAEHTLSTESEFSANELRLMMVAGKNYFVRQFMKLGVFVGGAGLESVPDEQAKAEIAKLNMAKSGACGS